MNFFYSPVLGGEKSVDYLQGSRHLIKTLDIHPHDTRHLWGNSEDRLIG